jgi:hypothetical protein
MRRGLGRLIKVNTYLLIHIYISTSYLNVLMVMGN